MGRIREGREVRLPSVSERAGQPATLLIKCCGEDLQEPEDISSVTPGTVCGKKSHTLVGVIGVRVVEVEPVSFSHAI